MRPSLLSLHFLILPVKFNCQNELITNIDNVGVSSASTCNPTDVRTLLLRNPANKTLNILTQNIRSIAANMNSFYTLLSDLDIDLDFIILTECRLPDNPIIPHLDGFSFYSSSNPANQNDGVIIYYNNLIPRVSISEPNIVDASCILITLSEETALLGIYRPCAFHNAQNFYTLPRPGSNVLKKLQKYNYHG